MKYIILLVFLLGSLQVQSRPLTIQNESNVPLNVIIWKDSKVIFHHVMNPNDEVTIEDIGHGCLLQFKIVGVVIDSGHANSKSCGHFRLIPNDYFEVDLNDQHLNQHLKWYQSWIKTFSINFQVEFIDKKA